MGKGPGNAGDVWGDGETLGITSKRVTPRPHGKGSGSRGGFRRPDQSQGLVEQSQARPPAGQSGCSASPRRRPGHDPAPDAQKTFGTSRAEVSLPPTPHQAPHLRCLETSESARNKGRAAFTNANNKQFCFFVFGFFPFVKRAARQVWGSGRGQSCSVWPLLGAPRPRVRRAGPAPGRMPQAGAPETAAARSLALAGLRGNELAGEGPGAGRGGSYFCRFLFPRPRRHGNGVTHRGR